MAIYKYDLFDISILVINMIDNDMEDEKIIAIPFNDPSLTCYSDISQLPTHTFDEIRHFFKVYKSLEEKETVVSEVLGREEAQKRIESCIAKYKDTFC